MESSSSYPPSSFAGWGKGPAFGGPLRFTSDTTTESWGTIAASCAGSGWLRGSGWLPGCHYHNAARRQEHHTIAADNPHTTTR